MTNDKTKQVDEDRVRAALTYLMRSMTDLHNQYGAAGDWIGLPVPLHEISLRLDTTDLILDIGLKAASEKLKEDQNDDTNNPI